MAPSVSQLKSSPNDTVNNGPVKPAKVDNGPSYPFYYPHYDLTEKFAPLEQFTHTDPGSRADPTKPHLLTPNTTQHHLSPYIGTELTGVQLSQLSPAGLDELALFVAERKVVILRDQDFKDIGAERQIALARHFGPTHTHSTNANVKGYPEFHVVYRDEKHDEFAAYAGYGRGNYTSWHSDVSYELQPPGTTFFFILDQPQSGGGDTLFLSQVEAYKRLSTKFKKRLEGLRAVHSGFEQAEFSRSKGGPVRRESVEHEHPIVRTHPVTKEKALYVNPIFTRRIVGFKKEESDALLGFLYDHIAKGADFQIRARYEKGTVVVWDNRLVVHSAVPDFSPEFRRHAVRLTPLAEAPFETSVEEI